MTYFARRRRALSLFALAAVVAFLFAAFEEAQGQAAQAPAEGSRVRATVVEDRYLQFDPLAPLAETAPSMMGSQRRFSDGRLRLEGTLLGRTPEGFGLRLSDPEAEIQVERTDLLRLESFSGRRNLSTPGAIVGGAAAGLFGLWISRALPDEPDTGTTLIVTTASALPGTLLGWLIGRWVRVDTWTHVPGMEGG